MLRRILPEELELGMYIDSAVAEKGAEDAKQIKFLNSVQVDSHEKLEKYRKLRLRYIVVDTDRFREIAEAKIEPPKPVTIHPLSPKIPAPVPVENLKKEEPVEIPKPEPEKEFPKKQAPAFIEDLNKNDDEPRQHIKWEPITGTQDTPFEEEVRQAKIIMNHTHSLVKGFMEDVRMGRPLDPEAAATQSRELVDSIFRNEDALVSLTRLKSFDEYTYGHSVNVSVLITAFAKKMGFNRTRLERLALGGICHDIGKAKIPLEVLNKPGRLTEEEWKIIRTHPTHGFNLLDKKENVHGDSKRVVLEHHERIDGKGYPDGKSLHELHIDSNIASICDVYDAMTSARVYKPGMPLPQAIEFLLQRAGTEFKRNLLEVFVEHIGAYPVGSLVELYTGELAVVRQIYHQDLTRPHVLVISDRHKKMLDRPHSVFLADSDNKDRSINRYLDPLQFNMNTNDFIDKDGNTEQK